VLGDLSHDRGDTARARSFWMGAWHLGDRDDGLIERLRSIGIDHPENEPGTSAEPNGALRAVSSSGGQSAPRP
jgi:hypothetical protein